MASRAIWHSWTRGWREPADHGTAVIVDTPADICRDRVLGRMICTACGWTDHRPETRCARCGASLQRRSDDADEAAFAHRLHDHDRRVVPILDAWSRAGLPTWRIDGTLDPDALAVAVVGLLDALAGVHIAA